MASSISFDCGVAFVVEKRVQMLLMEENLSRMSITRRSAVFFPMPGVFAMRAVSLVFIAVCSASASRLLIRARAIFGPIPDTVRRRLKISRSCVVRKPYSAWKFSRIMKEVCRVISASVAGIFP